MNWIEARQEQYFSTREINTRFRMPYRPENALKDEYVEVGNVLFE